MKQLRFFRNHLSILLLSTAFVGLGLSSCSRATDTPTPNNDSDIISQDISSSRTLTDRNPTGVDYTIKGEISVKSSAILTVEPGVTIQFEQDAALLMEDFGALKAVGTAAKPILFTGKQALKGFWKGLIFVGSNNTENQLSFCTVEYGGGDNYLYQEGNVVIGSNDYGAARVNINNSTIRRSSKAGFYVAGNSYVDNLTNNVITENDGAAAHFDSQAADQLKAGNDFSGNSENYVLIEGNGHITKNMTWIKLNVPYGIKDEIYLEKTLTLAAGVQVLGLSNAGFYVDGEGAKTGKLVAAGTASAHVSLTALQATKGFWKGIFLWGGEANLTYCDVDYAGAYKTFDTAYNAAIIAESYYDQVSSLTVTNCSVNNSAHWGIAVDTQPDAGSGGIGSTFQDNGISYSGNVEGDYGIY